MVELHKLKLIAFNISGNIMTYTMDEDFVHNYCFTGKSGDKNSHKAHYWNLVTANIGWRNLFSKQTKSFFSLTFLEKKIFKIVFN